MGHPLIDALSREIEYETAADGPMDRWTTAKLAPHLLIQFQHGPVEEYGVNGVGLETVLDVLIARLQMFQATPFRCRENAIALTHLEEARMWMQHRTERRRTDGLGPSTPEPVF